MKAIPLDKLITMLADYGELQEIDAKKIPHSRKKHKDCCCIFCKYPCNKCVCGHNFWVEWLNENTMEVEKCQN